MSARRSRDEHKTPTGREPRSKLRLGALAQAELVESSTVESPLPPSSGGAGMDCVEELDGDLSQAMAAFVDGNLAPLQNIGARFGKTGTTRSTGPQATPPGSDATPNLTPATPDLVTNPELEAEPSLMEQRRLHAAKEPAERHGISPETTRSADAAANLTLPPHAIEEGQRVAQAFRERGGADAGEDILEQLVAGEVPAAVELENIEAALVALMGRTVTDPDLFLKVVASLKETVAVSAAVRRRMQGGLAAAANLRAQRQFLQRGPNDGN